MSKISRNKEEIKSNFNMDQESLNSARDFRSRYEAEGEENYSSSYNILDKDDGNNKKTKIQAFTKERGFDEGFLMI